MIQDTFISTPLFGMGVFALGLLIGSFLNVVIHRLPARLEFEWRCQCKELLDIEPSNQLAKPPGLIAPRSMCPKCGHQISAFENIPVLSFLFLRGKCSSCGVNISIRYPAIELTTASLFLVSALHFGPTPQAIAALTLVCFLVPLTLIDYDHQLLPDVLTIPLVWIGLLLSCFEIFTTPLNSIVGAIVGYLILWSVYHAFKLLTGKEGMGYGDFKLLAALGAWMGWQFIPLIVVLSSLVGAISGIAMIATKKHEGSQPIPFGPFIALAGWIALLWGQELITAYFNYANL